MTPSTKTILLGSVALSLFVSAPVRAASWEVGDDGFKITFDNTLKYSNAFRLQNPKGSQLTDVNLDDGNRNFKKGLISNRADLLSEFTAGTKDYGVRLSGAAWYDTVYNQGTDNDTGFGNSVSVPADSFTRATRRIHGRNTELQDAFIYNNFTVDDKRASLRLGRHSLVFGESLFFGQNGVAAAQQPIDLAKLLSVPGTQFKELLMPVWQASGSLQLSENLSVGGYYQFQWRPTRLPAAGSYFSTFDFVGDGAERLVAGGPLVNGGGPASFWRGQDMKARDSGQFGIQARYTPEDSDVELGFYFAKYHDKTPQIYLIPNANPSAADVAAGRIGRLRLVYPEDIKTVGVSASTVIGRTNVAGEISYRWNAPLESDPQIVTDAANNSGNPAYAVGRTLHVQTSAIHAFTPTPLWDGASLVGEVAWNDRLAIDKNPSALDPRTTRSALALRSIFTLTYFQVANGLDVNIPLGIGWTPYGRSSAVPGFAGRVSRGGDISIGADFTYQTAWQFGTSLTHYFGGGGVGLTPVVAGRTPLQELSFTQTSKDRDFIGFYAKRSF